MTAPNALAPGEPGFLLHDLQELDESLAIYYDPRIIAAANLALEGEQKIEVQDYDRSVAHLDEARQLIKEAHPTPDIRLHFANHAAQTLTRTLVKQMSAGIRRDELPFGAETVRPHLTTGRMAIEAARRHEMMHSGAVDHCLAGAVAETLLPNSTNMGNAWLHAARVSANSCSGPEVDTYGLAAAYGRLDHTTAMFRKLDGHEFRKMRDVATFALAGLLEPPLPVEQYASDH
jgi:hypothetical protein